MLSEHQFKRSGFDGSDHTQRLVVPVPRSPRDLDVATVLVGPSGLSRDGLVGILHAHGYSVVQVVDSAEAIDATLAPALVILNDFAPDQVGLTAVRMSARIVPDARIVVLTVAPDPAVTFHLLKIGVRAHLDHRLHPTALIKSLNVIMRGNVVLPMNVEHPLHQSGDCEMVRVPESCPAPVTVLPRASQALSHREIEILGCLADGHSNKLIARCFGIAEATVKIHVKGILRKINVQNRTQAAIWVLTHGISSGPSDPDQ